MRGQAMLRPSTVRGVCGGAVVLRSPPAPAPPRRLRPSPPRRAGGGRARPWARRSGRAAALSPWVGLRCPRARAARNAPLLLCFSSRCAQRGRDGHNAARAKPRCKGRKMEPGSPAKPQGRGRGRRLRLTLFPLRELKPHKDTLRCGHFGSQPQQAGFRGDGFRGQMRSDRPEYCPSRLGPMCGRGHSVTCEHNASK